MDRKAWLVLGGVLIGTLWFVNTAAAQLAKIGAGNTRAPAAATNQIVAKTRLETTCDKLCTSVLTGKSPWLVMGASGAYRYIKAAPENRDRLGWFSDPIIFGGMLFLVALVGVKDFLLTWLSVLKAPLNALAEVMHVGGGLLAFVYLGDLANESVITEATMLSGAREVTAESMDVAAKSMDEQTWSTLTFLLLSCVHTAVWIVFNTVEVAIILSPFPLVDSALKSFRTGLIGLIAGATEIHPVLGFALSLPIILACLLTIPFAIRFTIVGWIFTRDTLMRLMGNPPQPLDSPIIAFGSWHLSGVRLFTYGTLQPREGGGLEFVHRRLFVLWRRHVPISADRLAIATGTLNPSLVFIDDDGSHRTYLRLPPAYDGREAELAQKLSVPNVVDGTLTRSLKQMVARIRDWMWPRKLVTT